MNRQGPVLFEAPLAHEHASHCNCRECRNNFAQAFAPGWAEREWEATATNNIIFGLDTAEMDGNKKPNWVQAKTKGAISFAIIRANEGIREDLAFKSYWPKIKDAGIVRGAYLLPRFPHWKYSDPVAQAKAFIKTVRKLNEPDLPPTLDVEFPGGREVTGMTAKQLLDGVRAAWKVLRAHYGVAPIIYTSVHVWRDDLHNLLAPDLMESPLWVKYYPTRLNTPGRDGRLAVSWGPSRGDPPLPQPWGKSNWWIHQYQGDAHRLPGFPGKVDMNRFKTMLKGAVGDGDRVKWVQRRLGIAQNGRFDDAMESALRAFQKKKGLVSNGVVGPQTFAYLCWSNP